jgi:hypothetical protein
MMTALLAISIGGVLIVGLVADLAVLVAWLRHQRKADIEKR